ncbi:MAG: hypothetical protein GQ574_26110 [Crocinitomix sp.]|nr:hypothetical protein [Crocinitomix sp.]
MKRSFVIIIALFFVLAACKKKGFNSISETNELGNAIDHADATDWIEDEGAWSNKIEKLMGEGCDLGAYGNTSEVVILPAYPNPFTTWTEVYFSTGDSCLINVLLVDKQNNSYFRECFQLNGGDAIIGIDANVFELSSNKYYRLYYDFSNSSGESFYKGHGDIKTL